MTRYCANCVALRQQVVDLERQMGNSFPKGAMGTISERFGVSPNAARLLLTFYYRDDWTKWDYIERHLDIGERVLRFTIHRMREQLGHDALESHWGFGYRLPAKMRTQIEEVLG